MDRRELITWFDRLNPYTDRMIQRDIEKYRKGLFAVKLQDGGKNPVAGRRVKVKLKKHEFKFGSALFQLDQFGDERRNSLYREEFRKVFNYGVLPLYWDTLEPERGKLRFSKDSAPIYRRPQLDLIREYCIENGIGMKGHCLMYNSYNPKWMPRDFRTLKMEIVRRSREIAERYGDDLIDLDVINEMFSIYHNAHGEYGTRDLPVCDEKGHEKWCFDVAKRYFPNTTLFWNEGCYETFGRSIGQFTGDKSVYYLMLKRWIAEGAQIEGIGMQFHAFDSNESQEKAIYNPYRAMEVFDVYSEFNLPIHLSEVSIPSYGNDEEGEYVQAELVERMYRLWFSREKVESIVWWNIADGMAYGDENRFHGGLLRNDLSHKPAFDVIDRLVNREWQTEAELVTDENGRAYFEGFYGDYEVEIDGTTEIRPFHRENTGYYHVTAGPKEQKFILP